MTETSDTLNWIDANTKFSAEVTYNDPTPTPDLEVTPSTDLVQKAQESALQVATKRYGKDVRVSLCQQILVNAYVSDQTIKSLQDFQTNVADIKSENDATLAKMAESDASDFGPEVVAARGTYPLLKDRLAATDKKLEDAADPSEFQADLQATNDFNLGEGMHFVAHRGNNAEWPENSKRAFQTVTRHWGIETDISVTKDGYWVVMHDATVDRMTDGTGNVADLTLAQIQALKFDTGTNLALCSDDELKVPTVEDYLGICKANGKTAFLEIKKATYTDANYDSLANAINQYGMAKSMVIISFYFEALQAMKQRLPWLTTSYLASTYSDADADKAATLGPNSGIDTGGFANVTAAQVAYAHSKGLKFGLWTPTDDTNRASWQTMGVDYVTTNSKSGDLRWGEITLENGWTTTSNGRIAAPFVEQTSARMAHIYINVHSGTATKGTKMGQLPDWAIPTNDFWSPATVRTASGVVLGGIDIRGLVAGTGLPGNLAAGYNLDQKASGNTGWVNFDVTYNL